MIRQSVLVQYFLLCTHYIGNYAESDDLRLTGSVSSCHLLTVEGKPKFKTTLSGRSCDLYENAAIAACKDHALTG